MRKIVLVSFLSLLALIFFGSNQLSAKSVMKLSETVFDFGTMSESGGKVSHVFEFSNTGDEPLVILSAEVSCTCTKIEFPKNPIPAGSKGKITVTYNPKRQSGSFLKNINIFVNTESRVDIITIKGVVEK